MTFIYDKLAFDNIHIKLEYLAVSFSNAAVLSKFSFNVSHYALNTSFLYGIRAVRILG
jgi:hypothetical protein